MYQTSTSFPPRPKRRRGRKRRSDRVRGLPVHGLWLAIPLALFVSVGLIVAGGTGRPVEVALLLAAAALAYLVGWPVSGHAALGAGAGYLILEAVFGRLDSSHLAGQLLFTAGILGTVLAAGASPPARRPRRRRRTSREPTPPARPPGSLPWTGPAEGEDPWAADPWAKETEGARLVPGTLDYEVERARRAELPLSLLVIRPDELDFLSAAGADELAGLIDLLGEAIEGTLRRIDVVLRTGESRFEVVLPETGVEGARTVAERVRLRIDSSRPELSPGRPVGLSVSIGVAAFPADGTTAPELSAAGDRALARAVELGGNRTVLHSLPTGAPPGWALSRAERHLSSR